MPEAYRERPISYVLILKNNKRREIRVGKLGDIVFESGYYYYVGSSKTGLGRIIRHFRENKKKRWHIDYVSDIFGIIGAVVLPFDECKLAEILLDQNFKPIPKFGCSDCFCKSHLFYSPSLTLDFLSA
jgi:Uri superfamily endonuclease